MTESEPEFIVVVDTAPHAEADEAFERWLESEGRARSDLLPEDIRIDIVCFRDGVSRSRYWVRRGAIGR